MGAADCCRGGDVVGAFCTRILGRTGAAGPPNNGLFSASRSLKQHWHRVTAVLALSVSRCLLRHESSRVSRLVFSSVTQNCALELRLPFIPSLTSAYFSCVLPFVSGVLQHKLPFFLLLHFPSCWALKHAMFFSNHPTKKTHPKRKIVIKTLRQNFNKWDK